VLLLASTANEEFA